MARNKKAAAEIPRRLLLFYTSLNNPGVFEGFVSALFCNSFKALGGDGDRDSTIKLRHKDALLLQVRLFPNIASRVELGCADAVRISARNL